MPYDRLPPEDVRRLKEIVAACGLRGAASCEDQLTYLRAKYEPFVRTLAQFLRVELPHWVPAPDAVDAWQTSLPPRTTPER